MAEGTEVGKIFYTLDLDDAKFKSGVKTAGDDTNNFADSVEKAGKRAEIAIAAIGAGIVAFGVTSYKAWQETEGVAAQLGAVLESTGGKAGVTAGEVTKLSTQLEHMSGVSDEALTSAQSMLLTFTNIGHDVFADTTKATLDMATAMNGGLAPSTEQLRDKAILLGKALQDPDAGLGALHRVGVNVDELKKQFTDSMSVQDKQILILKELNTEFGGSAKAAGETFVGRLNILKQTFNDLQEQVGHTLTDALYPLAKWLGDVMTKISDAGGIFAYFKQVLNEHQAAASVLAGVLLGLLVPAVVALGISLWAALAPILPFIAIGAALGLLFNQLAQSMGGWHVIIQRVHEGISFVWNIITTQFLPSLQALWHNVQENLVPQLERLWQTVEPGLTTVLKVLGVIIGVMLIVAVRAFIDVIGFLIRVEGDLAAAISNVIQWLVNYWNKWYEVARAVVGAAQQIYNGVVNAVSSIGSAVSGALSGAYNAVTGWFNTFYTSGLRLIQSLARGIADGVGSAVSAAKGVLSKVRNLLPFSDAKEGPLSDLTLSGQRFSETFAKGIANGAGAITDAANSALSINMPGSPGANTQTALSGGSYITNTIGTIHINSPADADNLLAKLTRSDQLISMGLSG